VTGPDVALTAVEGLASRAGEGEAVLQMDEEAFRAFYDRTARVLWGYLSRVTGEPQAADDLLQECYFRFLRAGVAFEGEAHRRHYLFKIATNLARDRHRRRRPEQPLPDEEVLHGLTADDDVVGRAERRADVRRALECLKPRERELLWLAYAEGASHHEIARLLGLRALGVRVLLFRARRKLLGLLQTRPGASRAGVTP
jgi:RNA polymerase sigma-70 factor (ECF subfamily)